MKKFLLPILFTFFLLSCNQTNKPLDKVAGEGTPKEVVVKEPLLKQYIDAYLAKNQDCFNNEITEQECSKVFATDFLLTQLGDSIPCISELPLKFDMILPYDNEKCIIKFDFGISQKILSKDYDVSFHIFSVVDKKTVLPLKQKELYYIKGSCYNYANSNSSSESYTYYDDPPRLRNRKPVEFYLGTLIVLDISFVPVKKE